MDARKALSSSKSRGGLPWVWGATPDEVAATYPCDRLGAAESIDHAASARAGGDRAIRAISVTASTERVFAWLGNLRAAPYSYDWVDNFGRPSPRRLMPELGPLKVGQRVMTIFTAVDVVPGSDLTLAMRPGMATWVFGDIWVTYAVRQVESGSRLIAVLRLGGGHGTHRLPNLLAKARQNLLAWGDLAMMRKQLHTLADLAEDCS